ncbi:MAG: methyltransferase domain-containing protein [Prevotellaceae bacterium]|jgi:SAM-dependent methyltransferase|nr:methyltransferase domain-containing protein [Prevotellaceae bacterium]
MIKYLICWSLNHVPRKRLQRFAQLLTRTTSIFYIGNKVECTICGRHYRKFLPYGYGKLRENALCPHCLSLERHRLIELYLKNHTEFYKGISRPNVLHVAPEYCFIKKFEKLLGDKYTTADLESPLAKVKMDVQNIPFPNNTFDVIFCNHIMEHVYDDLLAMRELYRVLKPGGWGIIQSPINYGRTDTHEDRNATPDERKKYFGQYDHLREYGSDYSKRLENCGFKVLEDYFARNLSPETVKRYSTSREIIYLVKK